MKKLNEQIGINPAIQDLISIGLIPKDIRPKPGKKGKTTKDTDKPTDTGLTSIDFMDKLSQTKDKRLKEDFKNIIRKTVKELSDLQGEFNPNPIKRTRMRGKLKHRMRDKIKRRPLGRKRN